MNNEIGSQSNTQLLDNIEMPDYKALEALLAQKKFRQCWSKGLLLLQVDAGNKQIMSCMAKAAEGAEDYKLALAQFSIMLQTFPKDPAPCLGAARAAKKLDRMNDALRYLEMAEARHEWTAAAYAELCKFYLDIGQPQKACELTLEGIKRFKLYAPLYEIGFCAALKLYNFSLAGELCVKALLRLPALPAGIKAEESTFQHFLNWANKSVLRASYPLAVRQWKVLRNLFPAIRNGYSQPALVCLENNKLDEAENICQQGLEAGKKDNMLWICLVRIYLKKGMIQKAVQLCEQLYGLDANDMSIIDEYMKVLLEIGDYAKATEIFDKYVFNFRPFISLLETKLKIDLLQFPDDPRRAHLNLLYYLHDYAGFRHMEEAYFACYMNTLAEMSHDDQIMRTMYAERCKSLSNITVHNQYSGKPNIKSAFIIYGGTIRYFGPILKRIDAEAIDLIMYNDTNDIDEYIKANEIQNFHIKYGATNLDDYDLLIGDINTMPTKRNNQLAIGLFHGVDAFPYQQLSKKINAIIVPFQNAAEFTSIKTMSGMKAGIANIPAEKKLEIAYSGPYHVSDYISRDKQTLRKEATTLYHIDIPDGKPLVYFLEDEVCDIHHISYTVNKIVKYATVIYKPLSIKADTLLSKLNPAVHVIKQRGLANNILRFAADYVLASFYSGSALTTFMIGSPLICYYSRIFRNKFEWDKDIYQHINMKMRNINNRAENAIVPLSPKERFIRYFYENGMLFDLLDSDKIKDAIQKPDYMNQYNIMLPYLQDDVLGAYMLEGAAEKTAQLITQYIKHRTFGMDCAAFFLHP